MIKKIIIGALIVIILIGIPAVMYFLKQQQAAEEEPLAPLPTATPAPPTPTPLPPTATPSQAPVATNLPVCSGLTLNRAATGVAPFTVGFTAKGTDSDGTIKAVTFRFGDGQVVEITTGGGIRTNTVSIQSTHTYTTAGNYSAEVVITDDQGGISAQGECVQTITVTGGTGTATTATPTATPSGTLTPALTTPTPTRTPTPTLTLNQSPTPTQGGPTPTIESPGSNAVFGIGGLAAILLIVGAFLFFTL